MKKTWAVVTSTNCGNGIYELDCECGRQHLNIYSRTATQRRTREYKCDNCGAAYRVIKGVTQKTI